MLAGAEAIAARAQPPGKGGNIVSPEKLSNPVCLRRIFTARFWELWSFATENVGFDHRFFSY